MGPSERRQAIWEYLCNARFSTTRQLADRFGVCERTIRSDLIALACTYPIETSFGPYGGIRVSNWYHPEQKRLSARQTSLLVRVRLTLEGEDLKVMNSILIQFALPGSGCAKTTCAGGSLHQRRQERCGAGPSSPKQLWQAVSPRPCQPIMVHLPRVCGASSERSSEG